MGNSKASKRKPTTKTHKTKTQNSPVVSQSSDTQTQNPYVLQPNTVQRLLPQVDVKKYVPESNEGGSVQAFYEPRDGGASRGTLNVASTTTLPNTTTYTKEGIKKNPYGAFLHETNHALQDYGDEWQYNNLYKKLIDLHELPNGNELSQAALPYVQQIDTKRLAANHLPPRQDPANFYPQVLPYLYAQAGVNPDNGAPYVVENEANNFKGITQGLPAWTSSMIADRTSHAVDDVAKYNQRITALLDSGTVSPAQNTLQELKRVSSTPGAVQQRTEVPKIPLDEWLNSVVNAKDNAPLTPEQELAIAYGALTQQARLSSVRNQIAPPPPKPRTIQPEGD